MTRKPFTVGESGQEHEPGADCRVDWCGAHGYPTPCQREGCAGHVHAAFGDENSDGDYWLFTKCDTCGESE